ncbi:LysR family transcriptional regulator [Photobacterium makurazakiensis]|uniref:LysR family transcriptional regulator n=1 Tax=Photobacterium makurazakiensis TaxID=2910234 RepID=UPI003D0CCA66
MLDKMAFFVYVIRTGSISAAARKFNISVSAGSRWLQDLEQSFGITLCRRTNRLLTATPAGQKLVDEFSPLVDNAEQLCRTMQDYQDHDKGHINIACTPVYANNYLMDKISRYLIDHPEVTFNVNVTPWALDHASDADLVISANACYQGYREKDLHLVRRELMQSPFSIVASPSYLARKPVLSQPSELAQHQCLFATTLTGSNDWIFKKQGETQMVKVPKSLEVNDSDLLLQSAINGAGIAYLPAFIVEKDLSSGKLISLLNDYETSIWSLNLYYHPPAKASAVASHFKAFLLEN